MTPLQTWMFLAFVFVPIVWAITWSLTRLYQWMDARSLRKKQQAIDEEIAAMRLNAVVALTDYRQRRGGKDAA